MKNKTTRVMAKLLEHTPPPTERLEPSDPFISSVNVGLSNRSPKCMGIAKQLKDTYFNDPSPIC